MVTGYEKDFFQDIHEMVKALQEIQKRLGEIALVMEDKR